MKKQLLRMAAGLAAALAFIASPVAQAAVVTFDDVPNMSGSPFVSGGLVFTGSTTYVWTGPGYGADNGTQSLISGFGDSFTITKFGGGTFSISQLDAGLSWYTTLGAHNVNVGANVVGLNGSYQTFAFTSLNNVTSVTINFAPSDGYLAVDNIVWSDGSVPEPQMLLLLGVALLAGFAARRQMR